MDLHSKITPKSLKAITGFSRGLNHPHHLIKFAQLNFDRRPMPPNTVFLFQPLSLDPPRPKSKNRDCKPFLVISRIVAEVFFEGCSNFRQLFKNNVRYNAV